MKPSRWTRVFCPRLFIAASVAVTAASSSRAQTAPTPSFAAPDPQTVARYDLNRNGILDTDEMAAWQTDQRCAADVAPSAIPSTEGQVVELTPFEVGAARENGYYAPNTLSGTRINSRVEDLGAAITVVTRQQIVDTAALDINDVFKYEANTEGTFNFTAQNTNAPTTDPVQSSPATATRVRGITSPNIARNNFPASSRIPIDTYNLDTVEISRGPNSSLFGLGSPAGTININEAQANLSRPTNEVQLRADDWGSYRGSFNLNRPLLRDKLGIRVAALYWENEYRQKPSYDLTKRIYGTVTYRPFRDTMIRGSYEHYEEKRQTPNSLTPRDAVSEWVQAGRPTWNPLTFTATVNGAQTAPIPIGTGATSELITLPPGLYSNSQIYTRPSMFIDAGQVQLWEVNRLNTTTADPNAPNSNQRLISSGTAIMRGLVNAGNLYQTTGLNNKALYDWEEINAVPTNWNRDRAHIYTLEATQRFFEDFYARLAWHLEDSESYNRNISNPPVLQVDVNEFLLDGRRNPYFLRPFIQNIEPTIFSNPEYNDTVQAQLVYDLNFAKIAERRGLGDRSSLKWLGAHKILGYYENRRITTGTFRFREAIIDPNHIWQIPGALNYTNGPAINRPTYRYYVGPTNALGYTEGYTPPKSGVEGTFNLNYFNGATGQWVSEPALFGTAPYITSQSRQEITSRGFVVQSNLLNDHLVITGGMRKDFNRTRNSNGAVVNPATGFYEYGPISTWGAWTEARGTTRNFSAVLKPLPWFGLSYDRANSFQPQPPAVNLFGETLPNTFGTGQNIGGYLKLFDSKLVLSLKFYKNVQTNARNANTTLGSRIARLEAGTGTDPSLLTFAQTAATTALGTSSGPAYETFVNNLTQFPQGFAAANAAGLTFAGTNDLEAKGAELDLSYNPSFNWNIKVTAARTEAINTAIENDIVAYISQRMPYWLSVTDPQGNPWWTANGSAAQNFFSSAISAPLRVDQALLGKSNPQVKKYTARVLTTYRFTEGPLNNFSIGGSARWDERSVIGYLGAAPDPDGIVRSLDINRPIYDPARTSYEFWTAYKLRLFNNRIATTIQLNLQNAFEGGRLQAVAVNPDGSVYNWRIVNPRRWVLSTTFDF